MELLKAPDLKWYREIWSLDIQNMSWVENTRAEIDFIIDCLKLKGHEKVLDLACGFGRHSLELARRGFPVVGVDITPDYIKEAQRLASVEALNTSFICADLRDISFKQEFDVVLNLADGAIGYLENDEENLKIFDLISKSLKSGGKHFMDICNAGHAEMHFPKRNWSVGEKELSLSEFHWIKETRRMLYGGWDLKFGEIVKKPDMSDWKAHSCTRLYSLNEINKIFSARQMKVISSYGKYNKTVSASHREMQMLVVSEKV